MDTKAIQYHRWCINCLILGLITAICSVLGAYSESMSAIIFGSFGTILFCFTGLTFALIANRLYKKERRGTRL